MAMQLCFITQFAQKSMQKSKDVMAISLSINHGYFLSINLYSQTKNLHVYKGTFLSFLDPRPGLCYNDSHSLPETSLNFIKRHSLMDWSVSSSNPSPVFIKTSMSERLTVIAVDPQVQALNGKHYDVLFIGTSLGRILKVVNLKEDKPKKIPSPVLIETMQTFPEDIPVKNILITNSEDAKLVAISDHEVMSLPLQRCASVDTCSSCLALQDPYCVWDSLARVCLDHRKVSQNQKGFFIQELQKGVSYECQQLDKGKKNIFIHSVQCQRIIVSCWGNY